MIKRPILIQTAMEVECQEILKNLTCLEEKKIQGYQFYEGKIGNYPVVVLLSKVGVIHTSASVLLSIVTYHPCAIINVGIAGASSKEIHTGDIVVGESVVSINSFRTSELKEGEGIDPNAWELLTFLSGEEDRFTVQVADKSLLDLVRETPNLERRKIYYGRIGSGDIWNREADRMLFLNKEYAILCEDMESIATYTIANQENIPVISLKMISDNFILGEEYHREVGKDIQKYAIGYIEKVIDFLNQS